MPFELHVYYGNEARWNHALLERVQSALGMECVGFDGLQANFEYDSKDDALKALLIVRGLGVRATTCGVGEGPSSLAILEAREAMSASYKTRFPRG